MEEAKFGREVWFEARKVGRGEGLRGRVGEGREGRTG